MHWIEDSQLNHMSRQAYVQAPVLCVITLTIATSLSLYNIFGQPSAYFVKFYDALLMYCLSGMVA